MLFAVLASYTWKPLDPIGAILIAIYIIFSWTKTGLEETKGLTGISPGPQFLNSLTFIARNHHRDIIAVETVAAYHFGPRMIVEVYISKIYDNQVLYFKAFAFLFVFIYL